MRECQTQLEIRERIGWSEERRLRKEMLERVIEQMEWEVSGKLQLHEKWDDGVFEGFAIRSVRKKRGWLGLKFSQTTVHCLLWGYGGIHLKVYDPVFLPVLKSEAAILSAKLKTKEVYIEKECKETYLGP